MSEHTRSPAVASRAPVATATPPRRPTSGAAVAARHPPTVGAAAGPAGQRDTTTLLRLQRSAGNAGVTRLLQRDGPATGGALTEEAPAAAPPRTALKARYNGNYALAAQAVNGLWDSVGGIIARQQQAVTDFTGPGEAGAENDPSFSEDVVVAALTTALGLALGGIGGAITARLGRTIRAAALAGAIQGEVSGTVPAGLVGAAGRLAQEYVSDVVDYGKPKVTSYVSSSVRGNLPQATPLTQFGRGQLDTLNELSITQGEQLLEKLANAPESERWLVAQGLYDACRESLSSAYVTQRDAMTDVWLTQQVTSVGGGARPGVLNIELADVYADHAGQLRVSGANLLGEGANPVVRGWVAERRLEDIGIPKVVTMNGSLGWGALDCIYTLKVWSPPAPATGPTIGPATPSPLRRYLAGGPATITEIGGNRWGPTWLAAYHLGLDDLDNDDPRATAANKWAGAHQVWDNIKGRSITSLGGTIGASTW